MSAAKDAWRKFDNEFGGNYSPSEEEHAYALGMLHAFNGWTRKIDKDNFPQFAYDAGYSAGLLERAEYEN
jgi:hypothetical protein